MYLNRKPFFSIQFFLLCFCFLRKRLCLYYIVLAVTLKKVTIKFLEILLSVTFLLMCHCLPEKAGQLITTEVNCVEVGEVLHIVIRDGAALQLILPQQQDL
jgi:hypothetical protein